MNIEIDELTESLVRIINVQTRYNKESAEYEGYSWDWAGHNIIEELNDAKDDFKTLMDKYIDQRAKVIAEEMIDKKI